MLSIKQILDATRSANISERTVMLLKIFVSNNMAIDSCLANDICVNDYSTWLVYLTAPATAAFCSTSARSYYCQAYEKGRKFIYSFLPLDRKEH